MPQGAAPLLCAALGVVCTPGKRGAGHDAGRGAGRRHHLPWRTILACGMARSHPSARAAAPFRQCLWPQPRGVLHQLDVLRRSRHGSNRRPRLPADLSWADPRLHAGLRAGAPDPGAGESAAFDLDRRLPLGPLRQERQSRGAGDGDRNLRDAALYGAPAGLGRHDAAGARPGAAHAGRDGRAGADRRRADGAVRNPVRITPRRPGGRKCRAGADDCCGSAGQAGRLARGRRAGRVVACDGRKARDPCHPGPVRSRSNRRALRGADADRGGGSPVPAAPVPHELYRSAGRTRQPVNALGVPGLSRAHRSRDRADRAGRTCGAARRHRSRYHRPRPAAGERNAAARRAGVHRRVFGGDRHDRGGERRAVDDDHQ